MKIDTQLKCPKCDGTLLKPLGNGEYSCASIDMLSGVQCNFIFKEANSVIGTKVKVNKPFSPWNGQKGKIEEVTTNTHCPIKVKFVIGKQIYSEAFHPAYLERA